MRNQLNYVVAMIAVLVSLPGIVSAQKEAQENKPIQPASFLDPNTIGYLHFDVQELDFGKAFDLLVANRAVPAFLNATSAQEELATFRPIVLGVFEMLKEKGAKDAYVFLNLNDPTAFLIVPASDREQAKSFKLAIPYGELIGNNLAIGLPNEPGAQDILAFELPKRPDADSLLELSNGHQATLVIAPSDDHARVIREVMPDLPAPLDDVDGKLLSDGLSRCVVTIDSLDPVRGKVTIVSRSEEASQAVVTKSGQLFRAMADGEFGLTQGYRELLALAMKTFKPKQSGKVIELAFEETDFESLMPAMGGLIEQAESQAATQIVSNHLRELALGMFNFESENGRMPGYANFDKDGKPLLSWRVHLLGIAGQNELYKQFHLDEPWDSPHNIKLVDKMPEVFRAPIGWADEETAAALVAEGKTVYMMPRGEGMYGTREGLRISDVIDGTSNTIMLVAVRPELAVPWTQPVDVAIDLADPIPTLLNPNRQRYFDSVWRWFCNYLTRGYRRQNDAFTFTVCRW